MWYEDGIIFCCVRTQHENCPVDTMVSKSPPSWGYLQLQPIASGSYTLPHL